MLICAASQALLSQASFSQHRTRSSITLNFTIRGKKSLSRAVVSQGGIESARQCSVQCFMNDRCLSVNYNKRKQICELLDRNVGRSESKEMTVDDTEWDYYGYEVRFANNLSVKQKQKTKNKKSKANTKSTDTFS